MTTDNLLHRKLDLIAEALGAYRIVDVAAVMRRQKIDPQDGHIIDIIDYFPPWNKLGTYGVMKVAHEYMDETWQVERFEKFSALRIENMPLYQGETAVRRRFGITHACEVQCQPFKLMIQPRKDDDGNYDKTLILQFIAGPSQLPRQPVATHAPARPAQVPPEPEPRPSPSFFKTGDSVNATDRNNVQHAATVTAVSEDGNTITVKIGGKTYDLPVKQVEMVELN